MISLQLSIIFENQESLSLLCNFSIFGIVQLCCCWCSYRLCLQPSVCPGILLWLFSNGLSCHCATAPAPFLKSAFPFWQLLVLISHVTFLFFIIFPKLLAFFFLRLFLLHCSVSADFWGLILALQRKSFKSLCFSSLLQPPSFPSFFL